MLAGAVKMKKIEYNNRIKIGAKPKSKNIVHDCNFGKLLQNEYQIGMKKVSFWELESLKKYTFLGGKIFR